MVGRPKHTRFSVPAQRLARAILRPQHHLAVPTPVRSPTSVALHGLKVAVEPPTVVTLARLNVSHRRVRANQLSRMRSSMVLPQKLRNGLSLYQPLTTRACLRIDDSC